MTKTELQEALALEAKIPEKAIDEAKKSYKKQCSALYKQYYDSNNHSIKVGDVIKGQVYYDGKQMTIKVERIELHPRIGYKYFGTLLKANGAKAKYQLPQGIGIYQENVTAVNGNPVTQAS